MAFIPVPNVVEAELIMELFGQRVENTLYFSREVEWEAAQMVELGEMLQVWWAAEYASQCSVEVLLVDVIITDLSSATAPSIGVPAPPDTNGEQDVPTMPGSVTLTVSFRTAQRGRSARGRNYYVGLVDSQVVANDVSGATALAIATIYRTLLTEDYLPAGVTWVVVSRYTDNAPRVEGVSLPVLSVVVTDTAIDSQRRRLRGRGD